MLNLPLVGIKKDLVMIEGTVLQVGMKRGIKGGHNIFHLAQSLQNVLELVMSINAKNAWNSQGIGRNGLLTIVNEIVFGLLQSIWIYMCTGIST